MAKQTYTTGQVLTAAQMTALQANDYNWTVSAKTASYVLVAADAGTRITMSNAGATTITVNTALFTAGDTLTITNIGAGACTITAGTATVSTAGSLILNQYDSGTLYFSSTSAAIWNGANPGDITGITTGATSGLAGGVTSGTASLTLATAAKGDLLVGTGSNTAQVLTVGSNNQTLVADSTASTGLKWATPAVASSGLTFIQRSTFSGVANTGTTFDGVFSTTYDSYVIVLENCTAATGTDDPIFQFRYSGTTEASSNYFYSRSYQPWNASPTYAGSNSDTKFVLEHEMGNLNGTLFINNMGNQRPNLYGNMVNYLYQYFLTFGGNLYQTRAYTGFLWSSSSSNVSGTITVYGMAKS